MIVSLVVSFLILEGAIRSYHLRGVVRRSLNSITNVQTDDCRVQDSYLHHALKPNCTGLVQAGDDFKYTMHTNSFGLRSPETTLAKPEGVYRILVLGDSFTEGWGVADNETFSRVLEKRLNEMVRTEESIPLRVRDPQIAITSPDDTTGIESLPAVSHIEVINAGIGSYSPILEARYLFSKGLEFDPDMMFVMVDSNDLKDEYFYGGWRAHNELREKLGKETVDTDSKLVPVNVPFAQQSKLIGFLYSVLRSKYDTAHERLSYYNLSYSDPLMILAHDWEGYSDAYDLLGANMELMKSELNNRGIEFAVSVSSQGLYYSSDGWSPGRSIWGLPENTQFPPYPIWEMEKQFAARDITYINTFLPQFASNDTDLYFPNDGHWTPKGHEIVGKTLADYLIEKL